MLFKKKRKKIIFVLYSALVRRSIRVYLEGKVLRGAPRRGFNDCIVSDNRRGVAPMATMFYL